MEICMVIVIGMSFFFCACDRFLDLMVVAEFCVLIVASRCFANLGG